MRSLSLSLMPFLTSLAAGQTWDFEESFDQVTASPTPFTSPHFDVTVHSRDIATFHTLETMLAQHGPSCEPPPALHSNASYEGSVVQCAQHMMTAISAGGYGVIYVTPDQLVDFSQGEAVVRAQGLVFDPQGTLQVAGARLAATAMRRLTIE